MASQHNISDNITSFISGDVNFDYSTIKEKFYSHLNKTCPKTVSLENPCWNEVIKFIIKAIVDGRESFKHYQIPDSFATLALATYDVVTKGEKQLLVMKKSFNQYGENIIVIPNEECFELLVETHLKNDHAGEEKMKELLKNKYFIREQNIPLFLELCNICNPQSKMLRDDSDPLKKIYTTFIMDLHTFPDKPYTYLLCLVERSTGFCHLRPLVLPATSTDFFHLKSLVLPGVLEVALELFKIFADFHPPSVLMTPEKCLDLMKSVNMELTKMCPEFSVDVESVDTNEINKYDELVKFELYEWMSMTGSMNWATGCRMVQWKINNTKLINDTTPYESLFGTRPNDSLDANPIWLRNSDSKNKITSQYLEDFRKKFDIKPHKNEEKDGVVLSNKEAEMEGSIIADDIHPKCIICLHPVYKVYNCVKCKLPMHNFCGTTFVGRHQQIFSLCIKCKK